VDVRKLRNSLNAGEQVQVMVQLNSGGSIVREGSRPPGRRKRAGRGILESGGGAHGGFVPQNWGRTWPEPADTNGPQDAQENLTALKERNKTHPVKCKLGR